MKKWIERIVTLLVLAGLAVGGVLWYRAHRARAAVVHYRTAPVLRSDVYRTVDATGTVNPIKEVQVGAQVNGKVIKLLVDYNSVVTNGQIVALIDPQVYEANYASALGQLHANEASVKKCEAALVYSEKQLARKKSLLASSLAPVQDYDSALSTRDADLAALNTAKANVEQSHASASQAKANLDYCTIVSPVDGIVIERNIDEGQTVVSSFSASELLKIATSLTRIQVEASVPEADIGSVKVGQDVSFTVDAHAGLTFTGVVTQVRLAATTTSSVVTYPVIIEAENIGGKLYPGMTANIAIHISEAKNSLCVTSAALRYKPAEESAAEVEVPATPSPPIGEGATIAGSGRKPKTGTLYLLDAAGTPVRTDIRLGITDGSFTVIKEPADIEGREAVLGILDAATAAASGTSNPFMPKMPEQKKRKAGPPDGGPH